MKELIALKVGKKDCFLNFSLNVLEKITDKYESMSNVFDTFNEGETGLGDQFKALLMLADVAAWMSEEGRKYKEIVDGQEVDSVTPDEFKTLVSVTEFTEFIGPIMQAISLGQETEIKTKSKTKNAKATQDKKV